MWLITLTVFCICCYFAKPIVDHMVEEKEKESK